MSTHRTHPDAGFVDPEKLPRGPNGRALCRECHQEVPRGRRTFCGEACVSVWRAKTSPADLRVLARDHGVCAICGRDCLALEARIAAFRNRPGGQWTRSRRLQRWIARFGLDLYRTLWDADHILPVVEGGGPDSGQTLEQIMANLRTLCRCCHKRETRALARRRAEQRRAAKAAMAPQQQLPLRIRP